MGRSKECTIRCYRCDKYIKKETFWDAFVTDRLLCKACNNSFDRWMKDVKKTVKRTKGGE